MKKPTSCNFSEDTIKELDSLVVRSGLSRSVLLAKLINASFKYIQITSTNSPQDLINRILCTGVPARDTGTGTRTHGLYSLIDEDISLVPPFFVETPADTPELRKKGIEIEEQMKKEFEQRQQRILRERSGK